MGKIVPGFNVTKYINAALVNNPDQLMNPDYAVVRVHLIWIL